MNDIVINETIKNHCYKYGHATIALACKNLYHLIKAVRPFSRDQFYKTPHNLEESYLINIFINGELVFRPNRKSDEGMIRLKISDLEHPLEGKFDLSQCGNVDKLVRFHTGYPKEIRA